MRTTYQKGTRLEGLGRSQGIGFRVSGLGLRVCLARRA